MKRLLDTNAYAALKRGHPGVARRVRESEEVLIPILVVGELLFGFRDGDRYERNLAELEEFLSQPRVSLRFLTRDTADRFGRIATALKRGGTPIPTNDLWIAAIALETGAEVLTFDQHFAAVPGLALASISA